MDARACGCAAVSCALVLLSACSASHGADAGSGMDSGAARDAGASTDAGARTCAPACELGRDCCAGECTNLANDPRHCGGCGVACTGDTYCTAGRCGARPCTATCGSGETCCGGECCGAGQICCDPQGPIDTGPRCAEPDERGTCPVGCAPLCMCASPFTRIATPSGDRPIATLRAGDLVFSAHRGALAAVPILRTRENPVRDHSVVRVTLASGAILEISGRHPTADGRTFADLRAGGQLDGVVITNVEVVPYEHRSTYDILPDSDTGTYFAEGVLIGTTLARDMDQLVVSCTSASAR